MRKNILTTLAVAFAACLSITSARGATFFDHNDDSDFRERDSSRQTYALAPGATVEINSVSGGVTVETTDSSQAEVEIVRTARTREDLDCRQFKVDASPDRLRLDGNDERRQCRNVQVRQTVNLRLPRSVNLEVTSVSGHVKVGEIDGSVKMTSISGHATVREAAGEATFTSISGHVAVNLSRLGGRGVRMSSISGNIIVGLPENANADWRVSSISGNVIADAPGVTVQKTGPSEYEGRIGSGGTDMTFSSISGNVHFRRASD
jgi:DUF4097 and DUF4098 domain-containing protein YvlB